MPLLNYTTKVNPWTTNEGSYPVAISFTLFVHNEPLNFLLPCNHEGVFNALKRNGKVPAGLKNKDHALAVSWRIIKTWIEVQMAVVESGLITVPEVFMAHLIVNAQGDTLSQKILSGGGLKLLNQ